MSKAEDEFAWHIKVHKLPDPEIEFKFHPERRWRFDFAWPDQKIAVEIEGVTSFGKNANGTMRLGRHQTAKGLEKDCQKYGAAMVLGWTVYRCTQHMVKSGEAITTLEKLFELKEQISV